MKTIDDLKNENPQGKYILLRLDLNVPIKDGKITDATRIVKSLPTIRALSDMGAVTIILAHLGRPDGQVKTEYSLAPIARDLTDRLGQPVPLISKLERPNLEESSIALFENIRFFAGEEKNDPDFTKKLADMGDIFVNDAFSAAHRAHASTTGLTKHLPAYAGRLMQSEIHALEQVFTTPEPPVMAIVGGAKISTKLDLLKNLVLKTDMLVLGGGMANTFLKSQGKDIGDSLCEDNMLQTARDISHLAEKNKCELILPIDESLFEGKIFDIGEDSIALICQAVDRAKTILWNGPLGVFEKPPYDHGTTAIARYVAQKTRQGSLISVAGGGDTVSALNQAGVADDFSYISTAGGAFLEWLEGKELPGVQALKAKG